MNKQNSSDFAVKAAHLNSKRSDETSSEERDRLLLAIIDAEQLGFEATEAALIEMLRFHLSETNHVE